MKGLVELSSNKQMHLWMWLRREICPKWRRIFHNCCSNCLLHSIFNYLLAKSMFFDKKVFHKYYRLLPLGLWTFDLGVTQMIQESVDTSECGRFNSFQKALQSSFDLIYLTLVIALPRSDTYAWLGFVSYSAVIAGQSTQIDLDFLRFFCLFIEVLSNLILDV